jgi:hypothetical protein
MTPEQERLFGQRLQEVSARQSFHQKRATFYRKLRKRLGVTAIVLSALAGSSFLASVFQGTGVLTDESVRAAAGILALLSAVVSGLQTFYSAEAKTREHMEAANDYTSLKNNMEMHLTQPSVPSANDTQEFLGQVARQMLVIERAGTEMGRSPDPRDLRTPPTDKSRQGSSTFRRSDSEN